MTATTKISSSAHLPLSGEEKGTEAAWIIDPARALLIWASAEGAQLWGLDRPGVQSEPLDRAMPALTDLARIRERHDPTIGRISDGSTEAGSCKTTTAEVDCSLAFWTKRGVLHVSCRLLAVEADGEGSSASVAVFPVRPVRSQVPSASSGDRACTIRRDDVDTLREIARRIRGGRGGAVAGRPSRPSSDHDVGMETPRAADDDRRQHDVDHEGHLGTSANDSEAVVEPLQETIATLSHEVRTPLAAIAGLAEVMREEVFGPLGDERYFNYATDIAAAARHALDVVDATLARGSASGGGTYESRAGNRGERDPDGGAPGDGVAGDDEGYVTEFAVEPAIAECLAIMAPLARSRSITLLHDSRSSTPHVIADRRALKQVLLNLLANAVRATPRGGVVAVGARLGEGDHRLDLEVVDTGPGMTAEAIAVALGEVSNGASTRGTSDPARHAVPGLGLAIARTLAAANGCRVALEPREEGGLVARLSIPADRLLPV